MPLQPYFGHLTSHIKLVSEVLDDKQFTTPIELLGNATVGKHTRHIIEAFQAVVDGVESCKVSFDKRKRETVLELDKSAAADRMQLLFDSLCECDLRKAVELQNDFDYSPTESWNHIPSTLERELIYAMEHAIHHLAIIKIGIRHEFGIELPEDFGVAPSTIRFTQTAGNR
jgi:hypothetical protein